MGSNISQTFESCRQRGQLKRDSRGAYRHTGMYNLKITSKKELQIRHGTFKNL